MKLQLKFQKITFFAKKNENSSQNLHALSNLPGTFWGKCLSKKVSSVLITKKILKVAQRTHTSNVPRLPYTTSHKLHKNWENSLILQLYPSLKFRTVMAAICKGMSNICVFSFLYPFATHCDICNSIFEKMSKL